MSQRRGDEILTQPHPQNQPQNHPPQCLEEKPVGARQPLDHATALPAEAFTSPAIYEAERIFLR